MVFAQIVTHYVPKHMVEQEAQREVQKILDDIGFHKHQLVRELICTAKVPPNVRLGAQARFRKNPGVQVLAGLARREVVDVLFPN